MSPFWKIFISVIVTTAIVGGGGYYFMSKKIASDKSKLEAEIAGLEKSISDLKAASTSSTSSTSTATTDETADWKTYTNEPYKFSFKYPAILTTLNDRIPKTVAIDNVPSKNLEISAGDKMIQVWANPTGFGLEAATEIYRGTISSSGKIVISTKEKSTSSDGSDGKGQAIIGLMKFGTNSFIIAYNFPYSDRTVALAEFDTIITTFSFTK